MEQPPATPPSRRGIIKGLGALTWAGLVAALGLALEPGQVVNRQDVALVRDQEGLHALSLVCPHLGCRPVWQPEAGRFLCPCHGSAFAPDGRRLTGPAPRGLASLWVELDGQGRAWVDPNRGAEPSRRLRLG